VQASETLYWWFANTLVENGYLVLTYDPRGQGRSDTRTPDGTDGSNANPTVFVTNQVDAIDFLRSTPDAPYPHNTVAPDAVPAPISDVNPFHDRLDRSRLGVVGHSLGATGVSVVQGIPDDAWPGALDDANPVDVAVAWDNLSTPGESLAGYEVRPRVPAMGQSGDYFLTPTPKTEPPAEDAAVQGLEGWRAAGVDTYQVNVRGGTHYEWSLVPSFPTTSWDFGNPMADHYSLAWLDRYLKRPEEPGYHTADDRLLADDAWRDRLSFYYRSARDFTTRTRQRRYCSDIRAGCDDGMPPGRS
jgi:pimeloyl-ACP methyl ester carboxylesterase